MAILIYSLRKYIVRKNNAEGNSYEGLETDTYHKKTGGLRRAGAFAACGSVYGRAKGGGEGFCRCRGGKKAADLLRADGEAAGFRQLRCGLGSR